MNGLVIMVRVHWRTQRRRTLAWVVALATALVGTAAAIAGLYDTPAKISTYAAAVTAGDSLVAINGRVEGIDTLGGVVQNEFGFLAAFLVPLLGISLVARATRGEEEAGRLESLLSGRVSRAVPTLAALLVAAGSVLATVVLFAAGLAATGVPLSRSALYAASLGTLAFTFAGLAAVLAQLTLHVQEVYLWGLLGLAAAYVARGVGDVSQAWVTWLSPLGWVEKAAPFGAMRWWTLLIPLGVAMVLAAAAVTLAGRRDLGSSLLRGGTGAPRSSRWLRSPVGLAARIHRRTILGWLGGALILAATMGLLTHQFIVAVSGNHAMGDAIGMGAGRPQDGYAAVVLLYVAVIAMGYTVQAVGTIRGEETDGRVEARLAGPLSRMRWLLAHALVVVSGLVLVVGAASITLAMTTALSGAGPVSPWGFLRAGAAYLPGELLLVAVSLVIFSARPRLFPWAWVVFSFVALVALLGPGLHLPGWLLDLAPTTQVGNPPSGTIRALPLVVQVTLTLILAGIAASTFQRRDVPQT